MRIDNCFVSFIGIVDNNKNEQIKDNLKNYCFNKLKFRETSNWVSKIDTTFVNYNLIKDKKFSILNRWIFDQIDQFCKKLNYKNNLICNEAWINIYRKGDFQEKHHHLPNSLSAVYILESNPNTCAKTYFFSPFNFLNSPEAKEFNFANSEYIYYVPVPGRLFIFNSALEHCVEKQETDDERISIAYNFIKK